MDLEREKGLDEPWDETLAQLSWACFVTGFSETTFHLNQAASDILSCPDGKYRLLRQNNQSLIGLVFKHHGYYYWCTRLTHDDRKNTQGREYSLVLVDQNNLEQYIQKINSDESRPRGVTFSQIFVNKIGLGKIVNLEVGQVWSLTKAEIQKYFTPADIQEFVG